MAKRITSPQGSSASHRPQSLTALFSGGEPYPDWHAFNWKHRRFFLVNASRILGLLRIPHTATDVYLKRAREIIRDDTDWPRQYPADYLCSKTQLYPDRIHEPKLMAKAVAIVVALECMAESQNPDLNIYDHVRIVPAYYFVDGLTRERLRSLHGAYDQLGFDVKRRLAAKWGAKGAVDFNELWEHFLVQPQSSEVLRELSQGYCVTEEVAHGVIAFIGEVFDGAVQVGKVRRSGIDVGISPYLGARAAAPSLRPPSGPDRDR